MCRPAATCAKLFSIFAALALLGLTGCANKSVSRDIDISKQNSRLTKAANGSNVELAISSAFVNMRNETVPEGCNFFVERILQNSVESWAKVPEVPGSRSPNDLLITAHWTCRALYTDQVGGSATLAALTLGMVPMVDRMEVTLTVIIRRGSKSIFEGKYSKLDEASIGLWTSLEGRKALVQSIANRLVKDFTRELEGSEALEK